MNYSPGSLVKARGREWVVLPDSEAELLVLRPLGGTEDEIAGIYLPLDKLLARSLSCVQHPNDQPGSIAQHFVIGE